MKKIFLFTLALGMLSSCVSKKKYVDLQEACSEKEKKLQMALSDCQEAKSKLEQDLESAMTKYNAELDAKERQVQSLQQQLEFVRENNTNLLERLSDLSVVSKSGAESIKESLKAINQQNEYIRELNTSIQRKDSLNLVLVSKLKRSLDDINDEDIQIEVKKGVVYVSISDKLLFRSGSAALSKRASEVLGKVARVVNDHKQFEVLVEGHTDSVPISTNCLQDNWDLSVHRATTVVRHLQKEHGVEPGRMIAGGRSEYQPKATNETAEGRQQNRRTEIILTPKLNEFFDLMNPDSK